MSPLPEGERGGEDQRLPEGYRPIRLLSRGKRLVTWDAWDSERATRVVVKVLREDRRHEERVVQAVHTEGRLATELAHPHLVRGFGWYEDPPSLVLETLRGATLAAVIEDQRLGVVDAAELGLQLTSVLGYLHARGWLHLDLKPANVVVDHGRAVLIDLSLAARPGDGRPGAGTLGYRSPEQERGRDLSAAADIWGLGVTLLEALTGDLPVGPGNRWGLPGLTGRRTRRTSLPGGWGRVPAEIRPLILGCLEPDPAHRPGLDQVRARLTELVLEAPDAG